jgi:hypothetical protein
MAEIEIRMNLPASNTATHIVGPSGTEYMVRVDGDGVRWVNMRQKDAEAILLSSESSCAAWRSANASVFQRLGGEVRKPEPGIRIADRLAARDVGLRDPRDLGGITSDTLRLMRRRTR